MTATVHYAVSDRRGTVRVRTASARWARIRAWFLRDAQVLTIQGARPW